VFRTRALSVMALMSLVSALWSGERLRGFAVWAKAGRLKAKARPDNAIFSKNFIFTS